MIVIIDGLVHCLSYAHACVVDRCSMSIDGLVCILFGLPWYSFRAADVSCVMKCFCRAVRVHANDMFAIPSSVPSTFGEASCAFHELGVFDIQCDVWH